MLQDIFPHHINIAYEQRSAKPTDRLFCFDGGQVLAHTEKTENCFPLCGDIPTEDLQYLFTIDETACFLYRGKNHIERDGYTYQNAWLFRGHELSKEWDFAGLTAFHLAKWYANNRYCGGCGTELTHDGKERMLRCPKCGNMIYPKIAPAIILGVHRGDQLLMTKYKGRETNHYALIAGFVEIGETPEDTARREAMEETGMRIKNIRYYRSQPWAYSESMLIGLYAEAEEDSNPLPDGEELSVAEWVSRADIEAKSDDFSLTNDMICHFAAKDYPGAEDE